MMEEQSVSEQDTIYQAAEEQDIEERIAQRQRRLQEMKRQKQRQMLVRKYGMVIALAVVVLVFLSVLAGKGVMALLKKRSAQIAAEASKEQEAEENDMKNISQTPVLPLAEQDETGEELEENAVTSVYTAQESANMLSPAEEVVSSHVILVDLQEHSILMQRDCHERINPASMTKILTLLVAVEHVTDLDDTFTMTREITDFSYTHDCSSVGFLDGEIVTVRDLLYGTILPSGGDAAVGLAYYVAGSQEAFVDMMNDKLEALGLSETAHFTNCVGIYDENLYCTVYDMAMILEAALDDPLCTEVLAAHTYTTSQTEEHPEGITVSNWFLRRIEDKDSGGEVVCAKTGYVVQSGNCAASYEVADNGKEYICVTTGSSSAWRCIYDHVAIYNQVMG